MYILSFYRHIRTSNKLFKQVSLVYFNIEIFIKCVTESFKVFEDIILIRNVQTYQKPFKKSQVFYCLTVAMNYYKTIYNNSLQLLDNRRLGIFSKYT